MKLSSVSLSFLRFLGESPAGGGGERRKPRGFQRPPGSLQRADKRRVAAGRRAPESGAADTGPASQNTPRIQQHADVYLLQGRVNLVIQSPCIN